MRRITVVIADRYPVVLQGLSNVLGAHSDFNIVASCSDGPGCVEAVRNLAPDIAILDGSLSGATGPEIPSIANAESPSTRFVFFISSEVERELVMSTAADGYSVISKDVSPEILVQSLRQVEQITYRIDHEIVRGVRWICVTGSQTPQANHCDISFSRDTDIVKTAMASAGLGSVACSDSWGSV